MPELPEVETIARRLSTVLAGKTIVKITVLKDKSFLGDYRQVSGMTILEVSRRAKIIRFHLQNELNFLIHLKMTGQFIFLAADGTRLGGGHPTADWVQDLPSKHTRVIFDLKDFEGKIHKLYFNDQRIFGWVKLVKDEQVTAEFASYGPDIHTDDASFEYFSRKISKTNRMIKQAIMDNSIVSGVGNIYACDGLNVARIHPARKANSLSSGEVKTLLSALKSVISLGIEMGGATIDHYRNADGFAGKYQEHVRVYGLENEKCKNCTGIIKKIKIAGRGTYFCSECQR